MAECTIYDKLRYIAETKDLIKMAIESQDVEVLESDTFRKYAEYITEIRKVSSVNGMQGDVVLTIGDLDGYSKEEIDNLLANLDVNLDEYYTKSEIDKKGYITAIPDTYITEEELYPQLEEKVSETALNEALRAKQDVLESGVNIKTINGNSILGEGNIVIEGGSGGNVNLDLFEVVDELPTENINENKIYVIQPQGKDLKTIKVEGVMKPFNISDYPDMWHNDGLTTHYMQNPTLTVENMQIVGNYRTRVTFSGYSERFTIQFGLTKINIQEAAEQLYFGLGALNDLSDTLPDNMEHFWYGYYGGSDWFYGDGYNSMSMDFWNIDPTQTYSFDIWSNCGTANVGGVELSAPLAIFMAEYDDVATNKYEEYIYVDGAWERFGEFQPEVKFNGFVDVGTDAEGNGAHSYVVLSREDGSGSIIEITKINGKPLVGWEAEELTVAETKEVTQAEYDSMSKEDNVLYIITDAPEIGIPTKVSDLENDAEYVTRAEIGDIGGGGSNVTLQEGYQGGEGNYIYSNIQTPVGIDTDFSKAVLSRVQVYPEYNATKTAIRVSTNWWGNSPGWTQEIQIPIATSTNAGTITAEDRVKFDALYTKEEIDAMLGSVDTKISEINNMI